MAFKQLMFRSAARAKILRGTTQLADAAEKPGQKFQGSPAMSAEA